MLLVLSGLKQQLHLEGKICVIFKEFYEMLFYLAPISKMGDSAIWAFFIAVTVLVRPGPAVTATAPTVPVIRATASAAKTAET